MIGFQDRTPTETFIDGKLFFEEKNVVQLYEAA
jgi:hypothetical protein